MDGRSKPTALELLEHRQDRGRSADADPRFFLDFDGTLAPIAPRPDLVDVCRRHQERCWPFGRERHVVCVVSGRVLDDLRAKVAPPAVYYAADHGHHIVGPDGSGIELEVGAETSRRPGEAAADELEQPARAISRG